MDNTIIAKVFHYGGSAISYILRNRDVLMPKKTSQDEYISQEIAEQASKEDMGKTETFMVSKTDNITTEEKATGVKTGCIPCSIGHVGTCSGILNEAMRFARKDGISSAEVIDRVNICLDELNALERIDLRPEMTNNLPEWEKGLAIEVLNTSRNLRHGLESLNSLNDLEILAGDTQSVRQKIGRTWFQEKIKRLRPEDQEKIEGEIGEVESNV